MLQLTLYQESLVMSQSTKLWQMVFASELRRKTFSRAGCPHDPDPLGDIPGQTKARRNILVIMYKKSAGPFFE